MSKPFNPASGSWYPDPAYLPHHHPRYYDNWLNVIAEATNRSEGFRLRLVRHFARLNSDTLEIRIELIISPGPFIMTEIDRLSVDQLTARRYR